MKQLQRIGTICLLSILAMVSKAEDITATWDFKDSTVVADIVALSKTTKASTIKAVEKNGILLTVEANGKVISKGKNCIQGYVEIINKGKYLASISVVQKEKEPEPAKNDTLNKEPVKATFAFNLGTTGQKADFGTAATHFIDNKVTLGSNLVIKGADKKTGQTLIEPLSQQSGKDESNAVRFLIQPDFGLTFTPTKVTFKTTRYGTDNGHLDISWQNADKTILSLETGVKPNRDSNAANVTELSYDLSGATPGEGTCGLLINLYNLEKGKQMGFSNIKEGQDDQ